MYGWAGKILRIDLTTGMISKEQIDQSVMQSYLGGRGVNTWLLYNEVGPEIDPKGPDNKLFFGTGPLTGTPLGAGRMTVTTKSPQTGFINDGNMGGFFAPGLKAAGYDHIIVQGKAPEPVFVFIDDDEVTIRNARHLWGMTTSETHRAIVNELDDSDVSVLYIGPAGENQAINSLIITNLYHAGGRGAAGAVMGSKNLKAIAVRGTKDVKIADPKGFMAAYDEWWRELDPISCMDVFYRPWGSYGDSFVVGFISSLGGLNTRNDQDGVFEGTHKITCDVVQKMVVRPKACFACPFPSCAHFVMNKGTGLRIHAGTIMALGSNFGIDDISAIMDNHVFCNEMGLDNFAVYAISWAFEAYQKGIITKKDTDGLALEWGDARIVREMIRKMSYREGFGNILADGVKKASEKYGGTEFALQIKGLEMTTVPPRTFFGMALAYAVNDMGADHTRNYPPYPPLPAAVSPEIKLPFDVTKASIRNIPDEKGKLGKWSFDTRAVINSLEVCTYTSRGKVYSDFSLHAKALSAATGMKFTHDDLMSIGERICNLERSFNVVNGGASRADDTLPDRMLKEPYKTGGSAGLTVPIEVMIDEYYTARGWDLKTGVPSTEKLKELELGFVVGDFKSRGVIGE